MTIADDVKKAKVAKAVEADTKAWEWAMAWAVWVKVKADEERALEKMRAVQAAAVYKEKKI